MTFRLGDRVTKVTGDYHPDGVVVARFFTLAGRMRYAVEHEGGMLHIYPDENLAPRREPPAWTGWEGVTAESPLPDGTDHEVMFADGHVVRDTSPETWCWAREQFDGPRGRIIAYRRLG